MGAAAPKYANLKSKLCYPRPKAGDPVSIQAFSGSPTAASWPCRG